MRCCTSKVGIEGCKVSMMVARLKKIRTSKCPAQLLLAPTGIRLAEKRAVVEPIRKRDESGRAYFPCDRLLAFVAHSSLPTGLLTGLASERALQGFVQWSAISRAK